MEAKLKHAYVEEIKFQNKMLQRMKRWLIYAIALSSIAFSLIMFHQAFHPIVLVVAIIVLILMIVASILIGLAIKNSRQNIQNIIHFLDK